MGDISSSKLQYDQIIVDINQKARKKIIDRTKGKPKDQLPPEYKGKNALQKLVSHYNQTVLQKKLAEPKRVIEQYFVEAKSYPLFMEEENIDRLLASDNRLDSLSAMLEIQPYQGNNEFCKSVRSNNQLIQSKLEAIAITIKSKYLKRSGEIINELNVENIMEDDADRLMDELNKHIAFLEKYIPTLFSKEYLKNENP